MERQPSMTTARGLIIASLLLFGALFFWFIVVIGPEITEGKIVPESFIPMYFLTPIIIILLTAGIVSVVRYNEAKKIKETGKKSICKIVDFKEYSGGRSHRVSYYMIVEYRGFSGEKYKLEVRIPGEVVHKTKIGDKIYCYIDGDDCFVDVDDINVVKE